MSIFRSHLFPHITYIFALALVCVIGMSRLREALDAMNILSDRRDRALALVSATLVSDGSDRRGWERPSLFADPVESIRKIQEHYYRAVNRGEMRSLGALMDLEGDPEDDLRQLRLDFLEICSEAERGAADAAFLSVERSGASLKTLSRTLRDLVSQSDLSQLMDRLAEANITTKLDALGGYADKVKRQALVDVSAIAAEQDQAFKELNSTVMYTFIWLIILSIAYLYAVNSLLARPIKSLSSIARTVTAGRLLVRARLSTGGPVAELAEDFNRMVDMLVKSLNEQQRVVTKLKSRTDELQAANEHKNRFIANISHELKTPLNAVIGFSDILLAQHHGQLSERQEDYLRRIHGAGAHLLEMICDLIDVMKLDLNALQLKNEKFDVAKLTREVNEMMMAQADKKGHEVVLTIADGIDEVQQDPTRYKQIVINLMSNAIKFTPEKGRLEVDLKQEDRCFVLTVKDNGIGVSKRDQRRIFQDFIQLDSRLHRQHEGTGIGLPLTRRLVELMGGMMQLKSVPEEGSSFIVTLPISIHDPQMTPSRPGRITKGEPDRSKGVKVTTRRYNAASIRKDFRSPSGESSSS